MCTVTDWRHSRDEMLFLTEKSSNCFFHRAVKGPCDHLIRPERNTVSQICFFEFFSSIAIRAELHFVNNG